MSLITNKLVIISVFLLIITLFETLVTWARISGARVRLIATALSLFSSVVFLFRFSGDDSTAANSKTDCHMVPKDYAQAAVMSSGIINGLANYSVNFVY